MSNASNCFGKNISKLGFGVMRMPRIEGTNEVDMEHTEKMIDYLMANGMNYFDSAYIYLGGKSESIFRELVVKKYPRESYYFATKFPNRDIVELVKEEGDLEKIFNESLERSGLDYFDFYLAQGLTEIRDQQSIERGVYDFLKRKKDEGKIKHLGFSFHGTTELLKKILSERPYMEFVQLQLNYLDMEGDAKEHYDIVRSANLPIIVMEPLLGGKLARLPESVTKIFKDADANASPASWGLRYCGSMDGVMTVLSGMTDIEQVKENVKTFKDFKKLTDCELEIIEKAKAEINSIPSVPCTKCNYCDVCPVGIPIADVFAAYNKFLEDKSETAFRAVTRSIESDKMIDKCLKCGKCEAACPQHVKVVEIFEMIGARDYFNLRNRKDG